MGNIPEISLFEHGTERCRASICRRVQRRIGMPHRNIAVADAEVCKKTAQVGRVAGLSRNRNRNGIQERRVRHNTRGRLGRSNMVNDYDTGTIPCTMQVAVLEIGSVRTCETQSRRNARGHGGKDDAIDITEQDYIFVPVCRKGKQGTFNKDEMIWHTRRKNAMHS